MRLRIGTWNVEYARPSRRAALREVLNANDADVWVLTETHDDLRPDGCPHVAHSDQRPLGAPGVVAGSRWVSIWSRRPLRTLRSPVSDPDRTVSAVVDLGGDGLLLVYGTVMPWHADQGDQASGEKRPFWSEHYRVTAMQAAEWTRLRECHPGAKLCVAGDFNTEYGHRVPLRREARHQHDPRWLAREQAVLRHGAGAHSRRLAAGTANRPHRRAGGVGGGNVGRRCVAPGAETVVGPQRPGRRNSMLIRAASFWCVEPVRDAC